MDTSPYLAEMSANKRSVGLELKHAGGARGGARADRRRRRVRHQLLDARRARPRPRPRGRRRGQPGPRLRRPARLRLRPRPAVLRVPGVGPEPGAARRPRRAHRLSRPGAGRASPPSRRPTTSPGCTPSTAVLTGLEHRDRTGEGSFVDIAQFETTVSSLGPFLLDHALSGDAASARATGWPGWRRRAATRASATTRGWRSPSTTTSRGRRWPSCSAAAASDARFATLAGRARAPRRARRADRGVDGGRAADDAAAGCRPLGVAAYEVLDNSRRARRPPGPGPAVVPAAWVDPLPGRRPFSGHPIRLGDEPGRGGGPGRRWARTPARC